MGLKMRVPPIGTLDKSADVKQVFRQQERFNQIVRKNTEQLQKSLIDGSNMTPSAALTPAQLLAPGTNITQGAIVFVGPTNANPQVFQQDPQNLNYNLATSTLTLGQNPIIVAAGTNNVLYTTTGGQITTGHLTFDATTLALTGNQTISGTLTLSGIAANRLLWTGAAGLVSSGATFYSDGTSLGIGTATPRATVDILNAGAAQLRLTNVDNTQYCSFSVNASGNIVITPSGTFQIANVSTGFFGANPVVQQTVGANVNNVASSGTTGQFDDFTNGTVYATDYASLHNTVYQLTRSVAQLTVAIRNIGIGH